MIDETYVEFAPDINAITAVPLTQEFTNLIVLRGVSKFFAAPGMRLGYGITGNMNFLAKMRAKQTPWSLNSIGAFAGEIMLQDEEYIRQGFMIRDCSSFQCLEGEYVRFCIMMPEDNTRLVNVLKSL